MKHLEAVKAHSSEQRLINITVLFIDGGGGGGARGFRFCQLKHLAVLLFDLRPAGARKPRAGGVCKDRASLSSQP